MTAESLQNNRPGREPQLRPEQLEVAESLAEAHAAGVSSGYLEVATGIGKTFIAAHDAKRFREQNPGARVLYLCHDGNILRQARQTFGEVLGTESHGYFFGGEFEDQKEIVYATFQALGRRLGGGKVYEAFGEQEFSYVVVDESHHGPAPTYRPVIEHFKPKFLLGLTATPDRTDQQDIADIFGPSLHTLLLEDAIAQNFLARPEYHVLTDHVKRLGQIKTNLGKVSIRQLNRLIFVPKRDEEIVSDITEHLKGVEEPRMMVFCPTIQHAEHIAQLLPGNVAALHSKLPDKEQVERLEKFRRGELDTVVTVNKLNEGVDVPEANVVVFMRSTESRTVFLQQLGRGLRKIPGKDSVLILDFVATWERIDMLQELVNAVQKAAMTHNRAKIADTPFKFDFSEDVLNAIDIIKLARGAHLRPRKIEPRKSLEIGQVEDMLQASIPEQILTEAEIRELTERIQNGDTKAIGEFLLRRLQTIYETASRKAEGDLELSQDFFQDGCEAILSRLGSYATADTKSSLKSFANSIQHDQFRRTDRNYVLFPMTPTEKEMLKKIDIVTDKMARKLNREPTFEELESETGYRTIEIIMLLKLRETCTDIKPLEDAKDVPDGDKDVIDIVADHLSHEMLSQMLDGLSVRERFVIEKRYGLNDSNPRTLEETAVDMGKDDGYRVTRERIRQMENQALKKLQEIAENTSSRYHFFDDELYEERFLTELEKEHFPAKARAEEVRLKSLDYLSRADTTEKQWVWDINGRDGIDVAALSLHMINYIESRPHNRFSGPGLYSRLNVPHGFKDYGKALDALKRHGFIEIEYTDPDELDFIIVRK